MAREGRSSFLRRHRIKLALLVVGIIASPFALRALADRLARLTPPAELAPRFTAVADADGTGRTARGWAATRGVRLVYLAGTPEEIGAAHTALLYDRMLANERVLWDGFAELVPFAPLRMVLFDSVRLLYRDLDSNFPDARRRELAAQAAALAPDPYASTLPAYSRVSMLHALYDISLGFERSPLLGCTSFGLGPEATADGHALFARAFDFEAHDIFDSDKVVFLVHEDGKIPFASVAWPGFVGVVTGMNAEGVALAVHGARAKGPSTTGVPLPFSLREALATARDTAEAVAILSAQPVMVSHLVFVGDASGRFAVIERAPGAPAEVRTAFGLPGKAAVTNHFEGPLADDERDARVRRTTTTLARRARVDELLAAIPPKRATVPMALDVLRDHGCAGEPCPPGDRRSIDAFIATHGIVADLTTRTLWVSEGPRLSGRFVKIDPALLARRQDGRAADVPPLDSVEALPIDPALEDGRYHEGRARAGGPLLGAKDAR